MQSYWLRQVKHVTESTFICDKTISRQEQQGKLLHSIYKNPKAHREINGERKSCSHIQNKTGRVILTTLRVRRISITARRQEKETKYIRDGKKEIQLPLLSTQEILRNLKFKQKLMELMSEFSKLKKNHQKKNQQILISAKLTITRLIH